MGLLSIVVAAKCQDPNSGDNSMQYNRSSSPSGGTNFLSANSASISTDLYTGGLQASLPLYTLKSSDLQIPIFLNYTANNGVRPSDPNTEVGMNWSLVAGGSISRQVRGLPDEATNGYIGTNNEGVTVVNDFNAKSSAVINFNNTRTKRLNSSADPIDGEPDIFVITTPAFTAQFSFDQNGNAVFQNSTGLKVSHQLYKNSGSASTTGITVTDDQGTQYIFGTSARESTTTKLFGTSFTFVSTWYLEKIILYNNKDVVNFTYQTGTDYTVYGYGLSKNFTTTFPSSGFPPTGSPTGTSNVTVRPAFISTTTYNSPRYISSITTKLGEADFTYTYNSNQYITANNPPALTSIVIKQINPLNPSTTVQTFNLSYTDIETGLTGWTQPYAYTDVWSDYYRRLLTGITVTGNAQSSQALPLYTLKYNQVLPYPDKGIPQQCDYWGYVNSTLFEPDGSTADAYYYTNPDQARASTVYSPTQTTEVPTAQIMALQEVDGLGGSAVAINYESNTVYNGSFDQPVAGARVHSIVRQPGTGGSLTTSYVYTDASGHSTGQFWSNLYRMVSVYFGSSCCNLSTLSFSWSPYGTADDKGVMVGYSSVKVVAPNGGYIVNQFSNFSDYPDAISMPSSFAANYGNSQYGGGNVGSIVSSFSYKRGLLKSSAVYTAGGALISQTTNTYSSLDQQPVAAGIGMQDMTWYLDQNNYIEGVNIYNSNVENWRLTQSFKKDYDQSNSSNSVTTTSNYTYSQNKRLLRSLSFTDSKGATTTKTYYYADDTNVPMVDGLQQTALNALVAANRVNVRVHETDNRNGSIKQQHQTYQALQYGMGTQVNLIHTDQYTGNSLASQKFYAYDASTGNVISTQTSGGQVTSYLYGYNSALPIAVGTNVANTYTPSTVTSTASGEVDCGMSSNSASFNNVVAGNITLTIAVQPTYTYSVNYTLSGPSGQSSGSLCAARSSGGSCSYPEFVTLTNMPAGNYTLTVSYLSGNASTMGIMYAYNVLQGTTGITRGFFYEGFEEYALATIGTAHTGNAYYSGVNTPYQVVFTLPDSRSYIIQWWSWAGGKWTMNQQAYTGPMSIPGIIDDVRVFPSDAMLSTYTYSPYQGKTGETNAGGTTATYEYDDMSRQTITRDQNRNIVAKKCYTYAGQPMSCAAENYFTNSPHSVTLQRNNCGTNFQGGSVTYTVAGGTYSSTVSQSDADQQAYNDISENAQAYANANGSCSQIYYNVVKSGTYTKQGCPSGWTGSSVTYTVAANTYTSIISQADADGKAVNDVNANGQNYANTNGTCTTTATLRNGDLSLSTRTVSFTTTVTGNITLTLDAWPGSTYSLNYTLSGPSPQSGTLCASRSSVTCSYPQSATVTNASPGTYTLTISVGGGSASTQGMSYSYYGN